MNLEEFKKSMETDATKRATAQQETIKNLHREIDRMNGIIAEKEDGMRQLMNRRGVFSGGSMCIFCGFRKQCKSRAKEVFAGDEQH